MSLKISVSPYFISPTECLGSHYYMQEFDALPDIGTSVNVHDRHGQVFTGVVDCITKWEPYWKFLGHERFDYEIEVRVDVDG